MTLPNFFIVGSAKSGTTSLYYYLRQHPEIFMSPVKEPHYFADFGRYQGNFDGYKSLFSDWRGEKAVGEASTSYLHFDRAPARIKEMVPHARIIIILRNPADMAHSLWRHMVRDGVETLPFTAALQEESRRMSDHSLRRARGARHANYFYFNRALYHRQVKRYIDTFGAGNIKVLVFEEFAKDPLSVCGEIFSFLGVDPAFKPRIELHNEGFMVRHSGLHKLLTRPPAYVARLRGGLPPSLVQAVRHALLKLNRKPEPRLDADFKSRLIRQYRRDIHDLERLIGRDLSHWYGERN